MRLGQAYTIGPIACVKSLRLERSLFEAWQVTGVCTCTQSIAVNLNAPPPVALEVQFGAQSHRNALSCIHTF